MPIRDLKPTDEASRVKLRKSVIQAARVFLANHPKRAKVINPEYPRTANETELLTKPEEPQNG